MRVGEPLDVGDQLIQDVGGVRRVTPDEAIESDIADEGDGGRPVFGVDRAAQHGLPETEGNELLEVDRRTLGCAEGGLLGLGSPAQEEAGAALRADARPRQQLGGLGAEQDLRCRGRGLHLHGAGGRRTRDDQLAVGPADEEEVEGAAVQPDRHPERHVAGAGREPVDPAQLGAHGVGRGGRAQVVAFAGEQQQLGVAAELQQVGTERVGGRQQPAEGAVDDLRDLFGADVAVPCQPFGHPGEAGDVDQRHGALDVPVQAAGSLLVPVAHHAWQVRLERVRRVAVATMVPGLGGSRRQGTPRPLDVGMHDASFAWGYLAWESI
ncbi:MAG TPA: hypothetical protein VFS72_16650 [Agromyces sp.]|nr:hypothetical protein [Agromyces sp.]